MLGLPFVGLDEPISLNCMQRSGSKAITLKENKMLNLLERLQSAQGNTSNSQFSDQ
jgi:hypothetical protein